MTLGKIIRKKNGWSDFIDSDIEMRAEIKSTGAYQSIHWVSVTIYQIDNDKTTSTITTLTLVNLN